MAIPRIEKNNEKPKNQFTTLDQLRDKVGTLAEASKQAADEGDFAQAKKIDIAEAQGNTFADLASLSKEIADEQKESLAMQQMPARYESLV